jgi:hypothetical protein
VCGTAVVALFTGTYCPNEDKHKGEDPLVGMIVRIVGHDQPYVWNGRILTPVAGKP